MSPKSAAAPEALIVKDCVCAEAPSIAPPKEAAPVVVTVRLAFSVVGTALPTVNEAASMELDPRVSDEAPVVTETLLREIVLPRLPESVTLPLPGVRVRSNAPSIVLGKEMLPGPVEVSIIELFVSRTGEAVTIENEFAEILPPIETAFAVVAALVIVRPLR